MVLLAFTLYLIFGELHDPGHITVRFLWTQEQCDEEARYWTRVLDRDLRKTIRYNCKWES